MKSLSNFLAEDLVTGVRTWSNAPVSADFTYLSSQKNAPNSNNFHITWISGTGAPYFGISQLKFGYSYTLCNRGDTPIDETTLFPTDFIMNTTLASWCENCVDAATLGVIEI